MNVEIEALSDLYGNIPSWPEQNLELSNAAERICEFIGAVYTAVHIKSEERDSLGLSLTLRDLNLDALVKQQILNLHHLNDNIIKKFSASQLQLSLGSGPNTHATYVSLCEIGDAGRTENLGSILVGTDTPLNTDQEARLFLASLYLFQLANVTALKKEIQLRNQFLSIASHELKTPLTSIYGVLQLQERLLRMKREEPPEAQLERQHGFLKMVIKQVERLNELINGLLDVSRIQNSRFMVEPSNTDVAALLRDTVNNRLQLLTQEGGVSLHVDAPPTLHAWVDPVRMEEVFTNLMMNAIRFSPEGGIVWAKLKENDDSFRFSVRDQGPPVAPEDNERIFQPFERAQRTGRLGGLGLGLFISRQIAQLHGGNVNLIESVPGKGNVFEAHFPIRKAMLISA